MRRRRRARHVVLELSDGQRVIAMPLPVGESTHVLLDGREYLVRVKLA